MRRKAYRNEIFSMWESVLANTWYEKSQGDNTMTDLTELEIDGIYSRRNTIIINRADLPKVTECDGSLHCGENDYFTDHKFGPAEHRRLAIQQLAVAEFLEAREKAAADTAAKRAKRRNELACKFAGISHRYDALRPSSQRAIDYIIDLEDKNHG